MLKVNRNWPFLCFVFLVLAEPGWAEQPKKFKPGFHLKVTGGGFNAAIGDMNTHLRSVNDLYRREYPSGGSGEIRTLGRWAGEWQLEALWDVTPRLEWGLAISPFTHFKRESSYSWADVQAYQIDREISFQPEIKVTAPAKLSVYYSFYSRPRFRVLIHTGLGFYSAVMKEVRTGRAVYPSGAAYFRTRSWSAKNKINLGGHGGISIEYGVRRNLAVIAELQGRYVKMKDLRGRVEYTTNYGTGLTIGEGGSLHFFGSPSSYFDLDIPLPFHIGIPGGDPEYVERKAVLDLSGISLRFGLKVRIF